MPKTHNKNNKLLQVVDLTAEDSDDKNQQPNLSKITKKKKKGHKRLADPTNWRVYILKNRNGKKSYVGTTPFWPERLHQHNGLKSGGSPYCLKNPQDNPWTPVAFVTNFQSEHEARVFEFRVHKANTHYGFDNLPFKVQNMKLWQINIEKAKHILERERKYTNPEKRLFFGALLNVL